MLATPSFVTRTLLDSLIEFHNTMYERVTVVWDSDRFLRNGQAL